ncbi:uncharacterized protein LOC114520953 [Dendronephthya gigantea]|uniref:uncharacterized protein LOC114520953 n=1 Tax=Dendronephthya gigantea TaxID=151771 RepID=UPI00106B9C6C|nr:uncharacterized protein LOC114520953 [Dendronephthya gigantea]XP_028397105.1 uncharacterized protein LOC114520953 [Dendronephthya gigantea]XP_028397106.1 uncharacterized protein LOC114520953 [Dendronephthya gigantea]
MANLAHTGLLVILSLLTIDSSYAQSYSNRISKLYQDLSISSTCLNEAEEKSATFTSFSENEKKAVELVNIYTQECEAYENNDGKAFYAKLNENLRSGNPEPIWKTTGDLLSEGLILLGPGKFSNLYRSCRCSTIVEGTQFSFHQFASTSSDAEAAFEFLGSGKSFIHIIDATGTDIEEYSSFSNEKEILLRPEIYLNVEKVETDSIRIRQEIKKLVPNKDPPNGVKEFVVLRGSSTRRIKRSKFISTCE